MMKSLAELFAEEEDKALASALKVPAAADLTEAERAKITSDYEAKWGHFDVAVSDDEDEEDSDDEDEE